MTQPWYPFKWADYISKTYHLTQGQHGAYMLLLCYIYNTGKSIPSKQCYEIAKAVLEQDRSNVDFVLENFFVKKGDRYVNTCALEIIKDAETRHQRKVEAGRKGGKQKSSNARALPKHIQPQLQDNSLSHSLRSFDKHVLHGENRDENVTQEAPKAEAIENRSILSLSALGTLLGMQVADIPVTPTEKPKKRAKRQYSITYDPDTMTFTGITDAIMEKWRAAFPAVDIPQQVTVAAAWLHANPTRLKSNYEKFLYDWMKRQQDSARGPAAERQKTWAEIREEKNKQVLERVAKNVSDASNAG